MEWRGYRQFAPLLVAKQDPLLVAEAARAGLGTAWIRSLRAAPCEGLLELSPSTLHLAAAAHLLGGTGDTTLLTLNFDALPEEAIADGRTGETTDSSPHPARPASEQARENRTSIQTVSSRLSPQMTRHDFEKSTMPDSVDHADLIEIHHLMNRIAATADTAVDVRDYLDLLTPDAVFDFAPVPSVGLEAHRYSGHAEIRAGVIARREAGMQGPGSRTLHIVSDIAVESMRGDEASVHAAWQYLGLRDGTPALLSMGTYANTVRRYKGRWLLSQRVVTVY